MAGLTANSLPSSSNNNRKLPLAEVIMEAAPPLEEDDPQPLAPAAAIRCLDPTVAQQQVVG